MSRWPCEVICDDERQDSTHVDVDNTNAGDEVMLENITNEQTRTTKSHYISIYD